MREAFLRGLKMRASAFVDEAEECARALVRAESRFPGDYGPAMRRVARRLGISFGTLFDLHYRKPKQIAAERWAALVMEHAEQYRKERSAVHPRTAAGAALLRAADFVAGEKAGAVDGAPAEPDSPD